MHYYGTPYRSAGHSILQSFFYARELFRCFFGSPLPERFRSDSSSDASVDLPGISASSAGKFSKVCEFSNHADFQAFVDHV